MFEKILFFKAKEKKQTDRTDYSAPSDFVSGDFTPARPIRCYDSNGSYTDLSTDELVGSKLNSFFGWKCGAGTENLHVNMDGDVYGASCKVGGKLGNVFTGLNVPQDWVQCTRKLCSCGADLFIPKANSEKQLSLLRKTQNLPSFKSKKADTLTLPHAATERTHASHAKQVYWEIGRRCNYNCFYCWPWIHNDHESHKTLEQLITATQNIQKSFIKDAKVNFIISGGEPTLNPGFFEWVKYLKSFDYHISAHSNGSRLPQYYRELIHFSDLNISVHFEFYNPEKLLKVIEAVTLEKSQNPEKKLGHLEVKLMMAPSLRQKALEFEESLKKIPGFTGWCTWAIVPIRDGKMGDQIMAGYVAADFELFGDRNCSV